MIRPVWVNLRSCYCHRAAGLPSTAELLYGRSAPPVSAKSGRSDLGHRMARFAPTRTFAVSLAKGSPFGPQATLSSFDDLTGRASKSCRNCESEGPRGLQI